MAGLSKGPISHHVFSPDCSVQDWLGGESVGDCGSPVRAGGVACDVHGVCHNHLSVLHITLRHSTLQVWGARLAWQQSPKVSSRQSMLMHIKAQSALPALGEVPLASTNCNVGSLEPLPHSCATATVLLLHLLSASTASISACCLLTSVMRQATTMCRHCWAALRPGFQSHNWAHGRQRWLPAGLQQDWG